MEMAVGLFINTLPVRLHMSPDSSLIECFKQLQASQLMMQKYEHSPLAQVRDWSDVPRGLPLFESVLQFENYPIDDSLRDQNGSLAFREVQTLERLHYPVTVQAVPGAGMLLRILFDTGRYGEATIQEALRDLKGTLESIASSPNHRIGELPLFAERGENAGLREEWGDTRAGITAIDGPGIQTTK
jgi:non-ribosomal peptide synthetase component F